MQQFSFLGEAADKKEILIESTNYYRTLLSGYAEMYGMYENSPLPKLNKKVKL